MYSDPNLDPGDLDLRPVDSDSDLVHSTTSLLGFFVTVVNKVIRNGWC